MTDKEILELTELMLKRQQTGEGAKLSDEFIEYMRSVKESIEAKPTWIPVICHDPTDEELKYYGDNTTYVIDTTMPEEGQEILISYNGVVYEDVCDYYDGWCLESGRDWADIDAWMPFPEPYKAKRRSLA